MMVTRDRGINLYRKEYIYNFSWSRGRTVELGHFPNNKLHFLVSRLKVDLELCAKVDNIHSKIRFLEGYWGKSHFLYFLGFFPALAEHKEQIEKAEEQERLKKEKEEKAAKDIEENTNEEDGNGSDPVSPLCFLLVNSSSANE